MKEHVYRFIGAVFLTILALLGVGAVLHILLTLPFGEKGPEWIGAIGTVATLIGTIYLATAETRRRKNEESARAHLHGASVRHRLAATGGALSVAKGFLDILVSEGCKEDETLLICFRIALDSDDFTVEDALTLIPVKHEVIGLFISAGLELKHLRSYAKIRLDSYANLKQDELSPEVRQSYATGLRDTIQGTVRAVNKVAEALWENNVGRDFYNTDFMFERD